MADFITGTLTATDTICRGTTSTASQLVMDTVGYSGAGFTIAAGGSVSFWASSDIGVTWNPLGMTTSDGLTRATTASAAGLWRGNVSGYTHVGIVATAITGGSISTKIFCSPASNDGSGSGGGGGSGGMVPPGSTGITSLTTTGASGASTYSSATGVLNIPVYASGTINAISAAIPSNLATTSTTVVSSGFGIGPFTAASNPLALVCFNLAVQLSASGTYGYIPVYRTTGTIPASGAPITGGDVEMCRPRLVVPVAGNNTSLNGTLLDTTLLVGTAYRYYLGFYTTGTQTVTVFTGVPGPSLQVVELK